MPATNKNDLFHPSRNEYQKMLDDGKQVAVQRIVELGLGDAGDVAAVAAAYAAMQPHADVIKVFLAKD